MLEKLNDYWINNKCIISMDIEKVLSVFIMARTMYINKDVCDDNNFNEIFKLFVKSAIAKYLIQ